MSTNQINYINSNFDYAMQQPVLDAPSKKRALFCIEESIDCFYNPNVSHTFTDPLIEKTVTIAKKFFSDDTCYPEVLCAYGLFLNFIMEQPVHDPLSKNRLFSWIRDSIDCFYNPNITNTTKDFLIEKASVFAEKFFSDDSCYPEALYAYGQSLFTQEKYEEARATYEKILAYTRDPLLLASSYLAIFEIYKSQQNLITGLRHFLCALKLANTNQLNDFDELFFFKAIDIISQSQWSEQLIDILDELAKKISPEEPLKQLEIALHLCEGYLQLDLLPKANDIISKMGQLSGMISESNAELICRLLEISFYLCEDCLKLGQLSMAEDIITKMGQLSRMINESNAKFICRLLIQTAKIHQANKIYHSAWKVYDQASCFLELFELTDVEAELYSYCLTKRAESFKMLPLTSPCLNNAPVQILNS